MKTTDHEQPMKPRDNAARSLARTFDRIRKHWADLPRGVGLLIIAGAGVAILLATARPLLALVRARSFHHNMQLAEEALGVSDHAEVKRRALKALQVRGDHPRAMRLLLDALDADRDRMATTVALGIIQTSGASTEDHSKAFEVVCRRAPLSIAGSAWAELPGTSKVQPGFFRPFAERLLMERKYRESMSALSESGAPDTCHEMLDLRLRTHILEGGRDAWLQARGILTRAAGGAEPFPAPWISHWEEMPRWAMAGLEPNSLGNIGGPRRRLLEIRIDEANGRPAPNDGEIKRLLGEVTRETRLPMARMLAQLGRREDALALLLRATAPDDGPAVGEYEWLKQQFEHHLEWNRWIEFLSGPAASPLPPAIAAADRATALFLTGRGPESGSEWKEALEAAGTRAGGATRTELFRRVEAWMPERAREALLEAILERDDALPRFGDIADLAAELASSGRQDPLLQVLQIYQTIEPGNPTLITQHAYLGLLAGTITPGRAIDIVAPIAERFPEALHPRMVCVIASLVSEPPSDARQWLSGGEPDWERQRPLYRWLRWRATQGGREAEPALGSEKLLPLEIRLVERLGGVTPAAPSRNRPGGKNAR